MDLNSINLIPVQARIVEPKITKNKNKITFNEPMLHKLGLNEDTMFKVGEADGNVFIIIMPLSDDKGYFKNNKGKTTTCYIPSLPEKCNLDAELIGTNDVGTYFKLVEIKDKVATKEEVDEVSEDTTEDRKNVVETEVSDTQEDNEVEDIFA